ILALVAFFTDDIEGTMIITTMVVLSTVRRYWQEFKTNKAAAALKAMVSNTATVIRQVDWDAPDLETQQCDLDQGSQQVELAIQDLVPGDIILLSAGDMI
ncbi:magnesium-translocating P-type ATPase, partial [Acinetobacter guillouiae]